MEETYFHGHFDCIGEDPSLNKYLNKYEYHEKSSVYLDFVTSGKTNPVLTEKQK